MKRWTPLIISTFLGLGVIPALVSAQERMLDTTERKQPLNVWGAQFEEFEYRYSDDDEEIGVWDADFFMAPTTLKLAGLPVASIPLKSEPTNHWKISWWVKSRYPSSSTQKPAFG